MWMMRGLQSTTTSCLAAESFRPSRATSLNRLFCSSALLSNTHTPHPTTAVQEMASAQQKFEYYIAQVDVRNTQNSQHSLSRVSKGNARQELPFADARLLDALRRRRWVSPMIRGTAGVSSCRPLCTIWIAMADPFPGCVFCEL